MANRILNQIDDSQRPATNVAAAAQGRNAPHPATVGSEEIPPEVVNHLEELDDVIFAAIDGDQAALHESAAAWHRAVKTLGHDAIEETRRQYLRHAQSVWEELRHQTIQPPHKIFAAIEIIGLLVNSER
jgi:hypothetical protein